MFMKIRLLSLALFFGPLAALAHPFSYRTTVPADAEVTCDQAAQGVAKRLAQATGANVTGSSCSATRNFQDHTQTYSQYVVIVNYTASYEAIPYEARMTSQISAEKAIGDSPLFMNYADCLKTLAEQKTLFQKNTGLQLVAGHCEASEADDQNQGYYLNLEGFGQPQKQLYGYAVSVDSISYVDPATTAATVDAITKAGGTVAYSDNAVVYYYSANDIFVVTATLGLFDSEDACNKQVQDAKKIYSGSGMSSTHAFCVQYYSSNLPQRELTVVGTGIGTLFEDYGNHSAKYASFDECMTDKPRVLQNLKSEGQSVLGAICHPDENTLDKYIVEIYQQN
jgi:hypothetical protein